MPAASGGAAFEVWVRPTAPGGTVLASLDESAPTGFRLGINGQYQPYAAGASQGWQLTSSPALTAGVFAHLALVVNGTEAVLYVDGVETARTTVSTAPVPASAQLLGRQGTWDPATGLVGDIDEVRVWNGPAPPPTSPTAAAACWAPNPAWSPTYAWTRGRAWSPPTWSTGAATPPSMVPPGPLPRLPSATAPPVP